MSPHLSLLMLLWLRLLMRSGPQQLPIQLMELIGHQFSLLSDAFVAGAMVRKLETVVYTKCSVSGRLAHSTNKQNETKRGTKAACGEKQGENAKRTATCGQRNRERTIHKLIFFQWKLNLMKEKKIIDKKYDLKQVFAFSFSKKEEINNFLKSFLFFFL